MAAKGKTVVTPKGFRIRTFELPPARLDLRTASPRQLQRYGVPPPPDDPELRKSWERMFARPRTWIKPAFRPMKSVTHGPVQKVDETTNLNWGGTVASAPSGAQFSRVQSFWTVPDVHGPRGVKGSSYTSQWIGIDGSGSNDVLQAGTETDFLNGAPSLYTWWEWYPGPSYQITNIAVSPGDIMFCHILAWPSLVEATVAIGNESSSKVTTFHIKAPKGIRLRGNCAEWVIERPGLPSGLPPLANFTRVYFDEAAATLNTQPAQVVGAGSADTFTLVNAQGTVLATPVILGEKVLRVDWEKAS
jgi:hypothetical protein